MSTPAEIELGDEVPTALYRFYAADGALLYVGITASLAVRFAKHATEKQWWPQVTRKTVAWHPTRAAAMRAEYSAVGDERPLHNIATPGLPSVPQQPRPAILATRIRVRAEQLRERAATNGLLSDQAIAAHIGIQPSTMSRIVRDRASAGERFIAHVLGAFRDMQFDDLFEISVTTSP